VNTKSLASLRSAARGQCRRIADRRASICCFPHIILTGVPDVSNTADRARLQGTRSLSSFSRREALCIQRGTFQVVLCKPTLSHMATTLFAAQRALSRHATIKALAVPFRGLADSSRSGDETKDIVSPPDLPKEVVTADVISGAPGAQTFSST
jgi:hypothetical protein